MEKLNKWNAAQKRKADARQRVVKNLRSKGKGWTEIGRILGVSRQRAEQIWSGRR